VRFFVCIFFEWGTAMLTKKRRFFFVLVAFVSFFIAMGADTSHAQAPQESPSYLIGPNDILSIYVWKEAELTREVTVMPDGRVTFPLAGEIVAQGQSVTQLKKTITQKLEKYVTAPEVTVIVRESRSQMIYMIGKVGRPGPYPLTSGMTILQALSTAGGFTEWADQKNIVIVRRQAGKEIQIPFNYKEFTSGQNLERNIMLQPGDTIVVP
jgi:polysaccharide biosynthesis/export protein